MSPPIPFSIPSEFASGLADGSLIRIGTLLKENATGKIVAHIQETGIAQQVLSNLSPFSTLDAANIASSAYANVQLNQLKTLVEGLQVLQYANLGVAIAGIGVSIMGFAMINNRLKGIEGHIALLAEKMDRHFQTLIDRELRRHYSQVYVLYEKAELAYELTNSANHWRSVASQLTDESGFFQGEIVHLLEQDKFDMDLFILLVRSLALCNVGRVECLLLAKELSAAQKAASVIGQHYCELFDEINPTQLAGKLLSDYNGSSGQGYSQFRGKQIEIKNLVQGVRDITDAALAKPLLIETLMEKKINGRDYILALKEEKNYPLLLLQHGPS